MLPELYFQNENTLSVLPEWAYFYMNLGVQIASTDCDRNRLVVSLAVPTRAFAAALIMTGSIVFSIKQPPAIDQAQINHILGQQPGTSIQIRRKNGKMLRGILVGFRDRNGGTNIIIQTTLNEERWYNVEEYAHRITISETDVSVPKNQQSGRQLESPSDFIKCVCGATTVQDHILESSFEVLIVGKTSLLRAEICENPFYCKAGDTLVETMGSLQDIVRVRQFSGINQAYKAQCVSSSSSDPKQEIDNREPSIVIFDGAVAFLKHNHVWKQSNHIIVLDRTERQFSDAAELVNQNYAYRTEDKIDFQFKIPSNVEMMVYRENK